MLGELDQAVDALGLRDADDRRDDPRVAGRELDRGGGERDVVAGAGGVQRLDPREDLRARLAVAVVALRLRRAREHAAAERRRVERGDAELLRLVEQRLGGLVDQREAVVREHDVEGAGADVLPQQVDRPAGDAEVGDHALLLERLQGLERPVGRHALLEGDVLGVVEVDEPEPVEPEPLQALLDRAADAVAGEVVGLHVAIDLRLEHEAVGDAAAFLQHDADAALGVAVVVARVEEVDRAVHGPLHGRHRVRLRHVAGVGQGRVAERRGADAQRRDPQAGVAKDAQVECVAHGVTSSSICGSARHFRRRGTRPTAGSQPCSAMASGPPTGRWATTRARTPSVPTRTRPPRPTS